MERVPSMVMMMMRVTVHAFCNVFSLQCIECERIHRGQYRLTSIFEVGNHDVGAIPLDDKTGRHLHDAV